MQKVARFNKLIVDLNTKFRIAKVFESSLKFNEPEAGEWKYPFVEDNQCLGNFCLASWKFKTWNSMDSRNFSSSVAVHLNCSYASPFVTCPMRLIDESPQSVQLNRWASRNAWTCPKSWVRTPRWGVSYSVGPTPVGPCVSSMDTMESSCLESWTRPLDVNWLSKNWVIVSVQWEGTEIASH